MGTFFLSKMSLNVMPVKLFLYYHNQFLKYLCSGAPCGGFQVLLILDLWCISFHAVIVFGLGKNILFKSVLGHCGMCPSISNIFRRPWNVLTSIEVIRLCHQQFVSRCHVGKILSTMTRCFLFADFCSLLKRDYNLWSLDFRLFISNLCQNAMKRQNS